MCVQYRGNVRYRGSGGGGDILTTVGDVQYRGGYHDKCRGILLVLWVSVQSQLKCLKQEIIVANPKVLVGQKFYPLALCPTKVKMVHVNLLLTNVIPLKIVVQTIDTLRIYKQKLILR